MAVTRDGWRGGEDGGVGGQQRGYPGRMAAWADSNAGSTAAQGLQWQREEDGSVGRVARRGQQRGMEMIEVRL